ncbi:MAG TPA: helix-turn-helix domain-containing protein [Candidatus Egerieousia sp.]|nr:helix-turn-helix domain-containing protein [Candidatus Egerieousia sp.]
MAKIENEKQYAAATKRIEQLLKVVDDNTPDDNIKSVELVLLSNLVADYDEKHYPINTPSLSDILKLRMYERKMSQKELAKTLNISPSRVSEYMTGKSEPTLSIARTMVKKLSISPEVVLGL